MFIVFKNPTFDFLGRRKIAYFISAIVILLGLGFTIMGGGPNLSIDFVGGTQIILRFQDLIEEGEMRQTLADMGYPDAEVKAITGDGYQDLMIRISETASTAEENPVRVVEDKLASLYPDNPFVVRSEEQVGPKIGQELQNKAVLAILSSLLFIVIYLSWRFQLRYGVAAIIALAHDVLVVFGLFNILNLQLSLAVVAAFLTIVGYSLNDTIVVFDRIRENVKKLRSKSMFDQINISINETLNRTVLTSVTTLIVVLILYLAGGAVIHDFAFALLAGVFVGTYSSMFVASPVLIEWSKRWPEKRKRR
ncbi:protein translocase subunit SecF [bacterium]|nr:protein translocase subunit SecF [bacterium]